MSVRAPDSLIEHLQDLVQEALDGCAGITRKRMLVSQGWMVGGKTFALVNREGRIVVRFDDPAVQDELLALDGAAGWQFGKKPPMRSWLLLPESLHDDSAAVAFWLRRAWAQPAPAGKKKTAAPRATRRPPAVPKAPRARAKAASSKTAPARRKTASRPKR